MRPPSGAAAGVRFVRVRRGDLRERLGLHVGDPQVPVADPSSGSESDDMPAIGPASRKGGDDCRCRVRCVSTCFDGAVPGGIDEMKAGGVQIGSALFAWQSTLYIQTRSWPSRLNAPGHRRRCRNRSKGGRCSVHRVGARRRRPPQRRIGASGRRARAPGACLPGRSRLRPTFSSSSSARSSGHAHRPQRLAPRRPG